jgi:hypothetical protein
MLSNEGRQVYSCFMAISPYNECLVDSSLDLWVDCAAGLMVFFWLLTPNMVSFLLEALGDVFSKFWGTQGQFSIASLTPAAPCA